MGTADWGVMGAAVWGVMGTAVRGADGTIVLGVMGTPLWGAIAWQPILQQESHIHYGGAASVPHFHSEICLNHLDNSDSVNRRFSNLFLNFSTRWAATAIFIVHVVRPSFNSLTHCRTSLPLIMLCQ